MPEMTRSPLFASVNAPTWSDTPGDSATTTMRPVTLMVTFSLYEPGANAKKPAPLCSAPASPWPAMVVTSVLCAHKLGDTPKHSEPGSIAHVDEQPSPFCALPSSQ